MRRLTDRRAGGPSPVTTLIHPEAAGPSPANARTHRQAPGRHANAHTGDPDTRAHAGDRTRGHTADDRGSVLLLVPAAVLIVLVMASIAVDMSLVHLRQRQAHDLAGQAANDAATAAADQAALRSGAYLIDPVAARRMVTAVVESSELAPHLVGAPHVALTPDGIEVAIALRADYIFAGVVPGAPDGRTVRAHVSAAAPTP